MARRRFWWVPSDVKPGPFRPTTGRALSLTRLRVKLETEDMMVGNGATDPDAQALANWWNANFAAIAAEAYSAYPYRFRVRSIRSSGWSKSPGAVAFARFLYDNNIPVDFLLDGKLSGAIR